MDRAAANPGLDPEPTAGHPSAQQGGQVGAEHAKRGTREDRIRDPVLRPGVAVEQHGDQDDEVSQRNRQDGLDPVHAQRDEPRCEQPGGDVVRHPDPERHVVVGGPGPLLDGNRREVLVVQRAV